MKDSSATVKAHVVRVDSEHQGQRLDNFLLARLKGVPRTLVYRIVRRGEVRVNSGRVRPGYRVQDGDRVRIPPLRQAGGTASAPAPPSLRTVVTGPALFEDPHLLIIDKPAGTAVHGGSGIRWGLIESIRAARPELKFIELVHRLDRETSGCLILAKRRAVLTALHEDLRHNSVKDHRIDKRYLALVRGRWDGEPRLEVCAPLLRNVDRAGERVVHVDDSGQYAKSVFRCRRQVGDDSLVEIQLFTGRTHQARVHAAAIDHPIAGDAKYGDRAFNRRLKSVGLERLFLHAWRLRFRHPVTGMRLSIEAPLPPALAAVLERART